ncbi:DUF484 family protein [Marinobacterium aestuariivivens]|uniref:DUF484 family protein n=1 Tax=Marinobacterium aestuariivivens TaxID=1698799 RepID=A0ABW1ZYN2_9GAMM
MSEQAKPLPATPDEQQVADFLADNPDFFSRHSHLLEKLYVPHETGTAVSLVARQTGVLREKNQQLRTHLSDLIEVARHNDIQFEKTKRMVLALLGCETLDDVAIAIDESLCGDFHGDTTSLLLLGEIPADANNLRQLDADELQLLEPLLETSLPSCGRLPETLHACIFQEQAFRVQSGAVVPLVQGETLGLLAIGSYDPHYFQSSQGTLFLSYVGEVLSRVLSRILNRG